MDLHRRVKDRAEDTAYVEYLNRRRLIHEKRREVEEKAEILKVITSWHALITSSSQAIADSSAAMAGFAFYAYIEFRVLIPYEYSHDSHLGSDYITPR